MAKECPVYGNVIDFSNVSFPGEPVKYKTLDTVDYVIIAIICFVMVGTLLGNVSVIISVAFNKSMQKAINIYVANLAVADLLICATCMTSFLGKNLVSNHMYVLGPAMCKISSFGRVTCLISSVVTLSAIACDRLPAVLSPHRKFTTKQRRGFFISVIWLASMFVSFPLLFTKKFYEVVVEIQKAVLPRCKNICHAMLFLRKSGGYEQGSSKVYGTMSLLAFSAIVSGFKRFMSRVNRWTQSNFSYLGIVIQASVVLLVVTNRCYFSDAVLHYLSRVVQIILSIFYKGLYTFSDFTMPQCGENWPLVYDVEHGICVTSWEKLVYYTLVSVVLFFLPVTIISVAYFLMLRKLSKALPGEKNETIKRQIRNRKKIPHLVITVIFFFVICWMPLQTIMLYGLYIPNTTLPVWYEDVYRLTEFLAFFNSFCNPIIYGFYNKEFRESLCLVLQCKIFRKKSDKPESYKTRQALTTTLSTSRNQTKRERRTSGEKQCVIVALEATAHSHQNDGNTNPGELLEQIEVRTIKYEFGDPPA